MKSLCLIQKSIRKQGKLTEHEYHKHRPRKVLFSEHVHFVQIYMPGFCRPSHIIIWWDPKYNICITDKKLLHFELSKSSQILNVGKTGFPRPGQILLLIFILRFPIMLAILALCLMLSITLYAGIIGRSLYVACSYVYCCYIIVIQHEKIWFMHK